MGFTCGIYKVKKFNNLTLSQIRAIEYYYEYINNEWAQNNYADWKEYYLSNGGSIEFLSTITQEDIDAYKDEYIEREYRKSLSYEYQSWCSNGKYFHDWIIDGLDKVDDYTWIFPNKERVIGLLDNVMQSITSKTFKPVTIQRAFTENSEDETITSIPCDGVEVSDEEGNIKRYYTNDLEYTDIYIPESGYFDEDKYIAEVDLANALLAVLMSTDFDNEIVYYEGGW